MGGHKHGKGTHSHSHDQGVGAPTEHKAQAPRAVQCAVITCSDTRTPADDTSGQLIQQLLAEHGHAVTAYQVIKDEPGEIRRLVRELAGNPAVQAIIINGGTGISRRDSTFEAIDALLEKRLDGFGEVFRYLTYKDIGSPAIMTRATAGVYQGRIVFSTPGSAGAVRLAMESLILPELGHIIQQLSK